MSITDYVVFDQGGLFHTLIQATQSVATATKAPVERVAERLRVAFLWQQSQCHPSLVSANRSGVWIASGRNDFHVAKGVLVGTISCVGSEGVDRHGGFIKVVLLFCYVIVVVSFSGTYWRTVVPRGIASVTKWAFVFSSEVPTREGTRRFFSP